MYSHNSTFHQQKKPLQTKTGDGITFSARENRPKPCLKVPAARSITGSTFAEKSQDTSRYTSGNLTMLPKKLQRQSSLPNLQTETRMLPRKCHLNIPEVRLHPDQQQGMSHARSGKVSELSKSKTSRSEQQGTKTQRNENGTKPKQPLPSNSAKSNAKTSTTQERKSPKRNTESKGTIVGRVVNADAHWVSKCCKNCTKTEFRYNKKSIVCESCGDRYSDESELVKRRVSDITLKTEDRKIVKKTIYHRELLQLCSETGDPLSNHGTLDDLNAYLKGMKSLKLKLDRKTDVVKITKM